MTINLRWVALPLVAAAALLATALLPHQTPPPFGPEHQRGGSPVADSLTWSGYAAIGNPGDFTTVGASWEVPSVRCQRGEESYSIAWVGLDGANVNQTVEQVGTESSCYAGVPTYRVFLETFPAPPQFGFSVQPGDTITASVRGHGDQFAFAIHDRSSGQSLVASRIAVAQRASAEVIFELPDPTRPARTNGVSFASASINGQALGSQPLVAINLVDPSGRVLYSPSPVHEDGGFNVRRG